MTYADVLEWFRGRNERELHVVVYVNDVPLLALDGELGEGVEQHPSVLREERKARPPVAFAVGPATLGLDEEGFVSAESVGSMITIQLVGAAEVIAFPWRDRSTEEAPKRSNN
jgi:hypothetical protein